MGCKNSYLDSAAVKVLGDLVVSNFGINNRMSPLWNPVPQVAILRTCPNMTLAVERDVIPKTLTMTDFVAHQPSTFKAYGNIWD